MPASNSLEIEKCQSKKYYIPSDYVDNKIFPNIASSKIICDVQEKATLKHVISIGTEAHGDDSVPYCLPLISQNGNCESCNVRFGKTSIFISFETVVLDRKRNKTNIFVFSSDTSASQHNIQNLNSVPLKLSDVPPTQTLLKYPFTVTVGLFQLDDSQRMVHCVDIRSKDVPKEEPNYKLPSKNHIIINNGLSTNERVFVGRNCIRIRTEIKILSLSKPKIIHERLHNVNNYQENIIKNDLQLYSPTNNLEASILVIENDNSKKSKVGMLKQSVGFDIISYEDVCDIPSSDSMRSSISSLKSSVKSRQATPYAKRKKDFSLNFSSFIMADCSQSSDNFKLISNPQIEGNGNCSFNNLHISNTVEDDIQPNIFGNSEINKIQLADGSFVSTSDASPKQKWELHCQQTEEIIPTFMQLPDSEKALNDEPFKVLSTKIAGDSNPLG